MTAVARLTDPSTSHEAARALGDLTAIQRNVLAIFLDCGPMTDEALVDRYRDRHGRIASSTVRTRRRELEVAGHLEACGRSITVGGHPCRLFRARRTA